MNLSYESELKKADTMKGTMHRLKMLGIVPDNIVDIGAAAGKWTAKALSYWPDAHYVLIEPLEEQVSTLDRLTAKYANIHYHTGVAGSVSGTVPFLVTDDLDGSGVYGKEGANVRELPVLTVDSITSQKQGSFLMKLDTHGYEVPVLKGAQQTLKHTDVLIIEVYGFKVSPTALLFHQLSSWLEEKGFRLFDIVDVMRRQKDLAFWQADAVYLKENHQLFQNNGYR